MLLVRNKFIPFKGYKAMCIWPFVFIRKDAPMDWDDINHEAIHGYQQLEMTLAGAVLAIILWLFGCGYWSLLALPLFFWCYIIEWFIRLHFEKNAYRNISFENEAYTNEKDTTYLDKRTPFAWIKYL